jgi:FOG: Ankyrin repeat
MTNPFDIPELKYMIINLLDLKSIGQMVQINREFKDFIQDMPIYLELQTCLNCIQHGLKAYDKRYNFREKIFISACANACRNIIDNFWKGGITCVSASTILDTSLRLACENGHLEVAKFLVEKGANIHASYDLALQWACKNGHLEVTKFLVEKGANIHVYNDWALKLACSKNHLEVAKFLVDKGANIHADNDCALAWACGFGHLEVTKFLVNKGANIHADNDYALRWACLSGHLEVAKFLVDKRANIHASHYTYQYLVKHRTIKS